MAVKIELAPPRSEQELEDYYRLRYLRLRSAHGLPPGSERDHPAEAGSTHVVAKLDGRVVGAACWVVGIESGAPGGRRQLYVRFRQLAIDPEFEGLGIGIVMTRHIEREARALGAKEIVGNVRVERVPYFERLGFVTDGPGETLFGDVQHRSMKKPLPPPGPGGQASGEKK